MKRALSIAVVGGLCALSSFGQLAHADQRTPPPPAPGVLDQFKKEMDEYNSAMREREQKIREINQVFNSAINKASQDARSAMQIAAKPEQKNSVISQKRVAVATAIIAKESAMIALGQPPLPPQDPLRMQKSFPKLKEFKEKNRR
jgi:hypothetical protein